MADSPVLQRVRALVAPIASDLQLDLYDIEQRGGTLRITLDSRVDTDGGVDLEQLALATRLISRELDHHDPVPGRYTLEVSSPGIERALRRPDHFTRAVGERVSVRLVAPDESGRRRLEGTLGAADDSEITIVTDGGPVTVPIARIERAKTVFDWTPAPKPGKGPKAGKPPKAAKAGTPAPAAPPGDGTDLDDAEPADDTELDDPEEDTP